MNGPTFFFVCQPLIRKCLVRLYFPYMSYYDDDDKGAFSFYGPGGNEGMAGDWRRQDRLTYLTELVLPKMNQSSTPPADLQQVLAHCPNLTCLDLHPAQPESYQRSVVTIIKDSCPKSSETIVPGRCAEPEFPAHAHARAVGESVGGV